MTRILFFPEFWFGRRFSFWRRPPEKRWPFCWWTRKEPSTATGWTSPPFRHSFALSVCLALTLFLSLSLSLTHTHTLSLSHANAIGFVGNLVTKVIGVWQHLLNFLSYVLVNQIDWAIGRSFLVFLNLVTLPPSGSNMLSFFWECKVCKAKYVAR